MSNVLSFQEARIKAKVHKQIIQDQIDEECWLEAVEANAPYIVRQLMESPYLCGTVTLLKQTISDSEFAYGVDVNTYKDSRAKRVSWDVRLQYFSDIGDVVTVCTFDEGRQHVCIHNQCWTLIKDEKFSTAIDSCALYIMKKLPLEPVFYTPYIEYKRCLDATTKR